MNVRQHVHAPSANHGPNEITRSLRLIDDDRRRRSRRQHREPSWPSPSQQPQKNGFRAIVRRVTRGNDRSTQTNGRFLKRSMASITRSSLNVRPSSHVYSCDLKRNFKTLTNIRSEREFPTRFGSQSMIDSMRHDDVSHGFSQHRENMQKRCRIRAARTSDEHDVTPDKQFVIPYGSFDETTKRRRMRSAITAGQICTGQTSFRVQRSSNVLQKVTSDA